MSLAASNSLARKRKPEASAFKRWLMAGYVKEIERPFEREKEHHRHHPWWKVMCLTSVDYFSGVEVGGYRVLRAESSAIPNAIAAFLLYLRDQTGKIPHAYFHWGSKHPIAYLFDYVAFGRGDTAPVTREVLRRAEPDEEKRPVIHVGGY